MYVAVGHVKTRLQRRSSRRMRTARTGPSTTPKQKKQDRLPPAACLRQHTQHGASALQLLHKRLGALAGLAQARQRHGLPLEPVAMAAGAAVPGAAVLRLLD